MRAFITEGMGVSAETEAESVPVASVPLAAAVGGTVRVATTYVPPTVTEVVIPPRTVVYVEVPEVIVWVLPPITLVLTVPPVR